MVKNIILAAITLFLSGCIVMTKCDYQLLELANRSIGHMEGLESCQRILLSRETGYEQLDSLSDLADKTAASVDEELKDDARIRHYPR